MPAVQTGHLVLYQTVSIELIGTLISAEGAVEVEASNTPTIRPPFPRAVTNFSA
jgi:hypothetical protein